MLIRTDFIRKIPAAASRNAEDLKMVRIRLYPENGFSVLIRINNAAGCVSACPEVLAMEQNNVLQAESQTPASFGGLFLVTGFGIII